jgi:prepilin-type N-terminal cleavage/methylation domain-containing protein
LRARRPRARGRDARTTRSGFTLVEVLVVLAILVILFGLLFAPMMAGMDMATQGRIQARLQDTARAAAEQMRREIVNAMYVYPPPAYLVGTAMVTDYSEIVFVPSDTDASGEVVTPRRPRTWTNPSGGASEYEVVRYFVKPPDTSGGATYDENNPFVLMRQEGLYRWEATQGRYVFGSVDSSDGLFYAGRALSENSMTPREDYDIPATTTVCLDDGTMHVGYVAECPSDGSTNLVYLHDDVKFQPERIMGEALAAQEHNTVYQARHGQWMGTPNNGTVRLPTAALPTSASELQPRLIVSRWNGANGYTTVALDSAGTVRSNIDMRWNSATGAVQVGDWHTVVVHVDPTTAPAAGQFWPLQVRYGGTGAAPYAGDSYNGTGTLSGSQTAPLAPVYSNLPTQWGEPRMPIAYRIEPAYSDGQNVAAKVVPGSVRVAVVATAQPPAPAPAEYRRALYTFVEERQPTELGPFEFSTLLPRGGLEAVVQFSRYEPPSADQFGTALTAFDIYLSYYYRRNFDNTAPDYRDDVIYADYSTGEIINIMLIPQRYVELVPYREGVDNLVVPPDLPAGGVEVRTQAVLLNARR